MRGKTYWPIRGEYSPVPVLRCHFLLVRDHRLAVPEPHVLHVRDPEGLAGPDDLVILVHKLVPDRDGEHGLALDAQGDLVADVGPVILSMALI